MEFTVDTAGASGASGNLLLESGDILLMESGDNLLLESSLSVLPIALGEDVYLTNYPALTLTGVADTGTLAQGVGDGGLTIERVTGSGWDAGFHSAESYAGGAEITFEVTQTNAAYMIGLSANPTVDRNYTSIDYAIHPTLSDMAVYESGVFKETIISGYSTGDICRVVYTGSDVEYYVNGVLERTTAGVGSGLVLFADSSFNTTGGKAINVGFGPLVFGGTIDAITETDLTLGSQTVRRTKYKAVDFDQLAQKRVAVKSYEGQTAAYIVNDLITSYLTAEGVTAGTITTGPTLGKVNFPYIRVSDALDELAQITGFNWSINKNKELCFCDRTETDAAYDLSASNQPYHSISVERTRNNYANTRWLRAGLDLTATLTEVEIGDSNKIAFAVSHPVGTVTSVETNVAGAGYTTKTVGVQGVDTGMDWYYQKGSPIFSQDTGGTVLGAADLVRFKYEGQYPVIVQAVDDAEIAARAAIESGSGIYEAVTVDASIDDADTAYDKAMALLDRYGELPVRVVYETSTSGLNAGDLQNIDLTSHELSGDFLIESIAARDRGDGELRYTVTALSGQAFGSWVKFFRDLAQTGNEFVIRENEVLVMLIPLSDTMSMSDSVSAPTSSSSGTTVGSATAYVGLVDAG
jgi:hypothetical protein